MDVDNADAKEYRRLCIKFANVKRPETVTAIAMMETEIEDPNRTDSDDEGADYLCTYGDKKACEKGGCRRDPEECIEMHYQIIRTLAQYFGDGMACVVDEYYQADVSFPCLFKHEKLHFRKQYALKNAPRTGSRLDHLMKLYRQNPGLVSQVWMSFPSVVTDVGQAATWNDYALAAHYAREDTVEDEEIYSMLKQLGLVGPTGVPLTFKLEDSNPIGGGVQKKMTEYRLITAGLRSVSTRTGREYTAISHPVDHSPIPDESAFKQNQSTFLNSVASSGVVSFALSNKVVSDDKEIVEIKPERPTKKEEKAAEKVEQDAGFVSDHDDENEVDSTSFLFPYTIQDPTFGDNQLALKTVLPIILATKKAREAKEAAIAKQEAVTKLELELAERKAKRELTGIDPKVAALAIREEKKRLSKKRKADEKVTEKAKAKEEAEANKFKKLKRSGENLAAVHKSLDAKLRARKALQRDALDVVGHAT